MFCFSSPLWFLPSRLRFDSSESSSKLSMLCRLWILVDSWIWHPTSALEKEYLLSPWVIRPWEIFSASADGIIDIRLSFFLLFWFILHSLVKSVQAFDFLGGTGSGSRKSSLLIFCDWFSFSGDVLKDSLCCSLSFPSVLFSLKCFAFDNSSSVKRTQQNLCLF